jgi:hypothetical protein
MSVRLGPEILRLRGTFAFGSYLNFLAGLGLALGVVGISTGKVLGGLYGLGAGLVSGWPAFRNWRQEVIVHQEGFVWRRLTGTSTVAASELKTVRPINVSTYLRGDFVMVSVTLANGRTLAIERIEDPAQLSRVLWDLMSPSATPATPTTPATSNWQPPSPTTGGTQ